MQDTKCTAYRLVQDRAPVSRHDDKRRGQELCKIVRENKGYSFHAPEQLTFQATRYRSRDIFGSSTIDLVTTKTPIHDILRLEREIADSSDHYPIMFVTGAVVDRAPDPSWGYAYTEDATTVGQAT